MWLQFFAQNVHFAVNLFAALVSLGICWLYLDAWSNRHNAKELFKWVGFALLGISFLLQATVIEQTVLGESLFGSLVTGLIVASRLVAYVMIIIGQLVDPLQDVPKNKGLDRGSDQLPEAPRQNHAPGEVIAVSSERPENIKVPAFLAFFSLGSKVLMPVGGLIIALLYWRRATTGLERHLKPVAKAFLLFSISDIISLAGLFRGTTNPVFYTWVAAFGWVWWIQLLTLLVGVIILGFWVWGYLVERFFSELFMILTGMVVVIFLIVSVSFTGLLLRNIRSDSLTNLNTAANVLNYALGAKQGETTSASEQLAGSTDIAAAISRNDREKLKILTTNYLSDKKLTGLVITNQSGQVLLRAQDTEQWGDSLSGDSLIKRALLGLNQSTIDISQGVSSPTVQVRSVSAVHDSSGSVIGSIVTVLDLDSAFVDGIKKTTGLQSSVYGGSTLAATTMTTANGKARPVGVKLSNTGIKDKVLGKGEAFSGTANLQNQQMLVVLLPIKDVDNGTVGMLLVAEPQSSILLTAGRSVELTFILTAIFLLASVLPIYFIVKSLTKQLG